MGIQKEVVLVIGIDASAPSDPRSRSLLDRYLAGEFGTHSASPGRELAELVGWFAFHSPGGLLAFDARSVEDDAFPRRAIVGRAILRTEFPGPYLDGPVPVSELEAIKREVREALRDIGVTAETALFLVWGES